LYLKAAVILHVLGNGLSLFPSEVLRKLVMNDWAAYYRPMMNDWPAHYSGALAGALVLLTCV